MTITLDSPSPPTRKQSDRTREIYDSSGVLSSSFTRIASYQSVDDEVVQPRTVISSGVTDEFHKRLREGELIPFTEYHVKSESLVSSDPVTQGWYRTGGNCVTFSSLAREQPDGGVSGGVEQVLASIPSPIVQDYDPLLTKALGEANTGALLILLELAEAHKTLALVLGFRKNLIKRAKKLSKLVRSKYNPRTALDFSRVFADVWLEYRYGWRQLYFSSQDISRALEINAQEKRFVVNTGRGFSTTTTETNPSVLVSDPWINNHVLSKSATATLEQRAVVSLQVLKQQAALDFNLIGLGYELVPYSFVLDWFVNVGDVVRATWPVPSVARTAATSWKLTSRVDVTTGVGPFSCDISHIKPGKYSHIREEYKRTPFEGDIPVVFHVDPHLGLSRILDLISLTVGNARKHNFNSIRV